MHINTDSLKAFIEIYKLGSFTKAANSLGLSQSAISQKVSRLEDLLQATLFIRSRDAIKLTAAGEKLFSYATEAHNRGLKVIIAGAGGAAHLPGMVASMSPLPVIGVPVKSRNSIDGWDSVLSILQMPAGVPVATVALDGAKNAGILAAQILGSSDPGLMKKILVFKEELKAKVIKASENIKK